MRPVTVDGGKGDRLPDRDCRPLKSLWVTAHYDSDSPEDLVADVPCLA